jgi:uncharacterized membrane protein YqjE
MKTSEPPPAADASRNGEGGVVRQMRAFFAAGAQYAAARLRLASLESKEAGAHSLKLLLLGVAAAFVAMLGWLFACFAAIFLLAKALGENGWLWASLAMAAVHFIAAAALARTLRAKAAEPMFPLTTEEFKKDQQWLEEQR